MRGLPLRTALDGQLPAFVKPLVPKVFRAAVYRNRAELADETRGLDPETPVLVSEIVELTAEARAWIHDGVVCTCAIYEGLGHVDEATAFAGDLAGAVTLPEVCVVDVAFLAGRGWALLEANAAWGAGLNGCDPQQAAVCVARATRLGS